MKKLFSLKLKYLFRALMLIPLIVASPHLSAQRESVTLEYIKSSSTLNIGYREVKPFSFRDSDGKITGYTIELCNMLADELQQNLGIKKLAIHYIPISFTDRISALNANKIDLDCSANAVAPERKNSVSFSTDYFGANMRIFSLRTNNIKSLNDLKGRTIALPRGSKDLLELNRINREKNLSLSIITSDNVSDAFDMMMQKRTAALIMDDIVVYPYINQSEHPEDFTVSSEVVGDKMKYALMMRKADPLFVAFIDKSLGQIFESPLHAQLASKWLTQKVIMNNTQNTHY